MASSTEPRTARVVSSNVGWCTHVASFPGPILLASFRDPILLAASVPISQSPFLDTQRKGRGFCFSFLHTCSWDEDQGPGNDLIGRSGCVRAYSWHKTSSCVGSFPFPVLPPGPGEVVALKKLKMEKEKEGFPITSLREINMLLKARHPNIVHVRVGPAWPPGSGSVLLAVVCPTGGRME